MSWSDRLRERRSRKAAEKAHARWQGPRTAFVLSGGGVLGAVQVGQLKALIEAGIVPDILVGSSVGALNAAMVATEPTVDAMEKLGDIWRGLRTEDIFPGSAFARVWNIVARGDHIHSNDGIRRLIEQLPVRSFEELALPLHVCATNLTTGKEQWFSEGPIVRAILASTALPGVFPPVTIDGEIYVDGGVVNNVPISRAVTEGARRVFILTCGAQVNRPRIYRRPIDVLIQSFAHSRAARISIDIERYGTGAELIEMPTFDTGLIGYNDPSHSAALIERAYALSAEFLTRAIESEAQA